MHLQTLIDAWNTFFHAPESCAPQVLFRLLFGSLMLLNAVLLIPLVTEFYSVDSMWSLAAWQHHQGRSRLCLLHLMPPTTGSFRVLLLIHLMSCITFLLGWQFRVSSIVLFVTLVSIHHWNTFVLSSGDTLLRMMSFFAMFSSAGNAFSVDAWLKGTSDFPTVDPWPLRLMQLQISIVYLRTVYWKLRGATWWNGTAVWYPIWVDTYLRYRPPRWMLSLPMIRLATWGTLIEELALGTLIWVYEFRPYVMLSGIALHLVFECILNLRFFVYSNPLRERGIVFLSFSSDCKNPSLTLRVVINPNAFACFTNQRVRTRNFKTDAADYGEMSFFRPTTVSNHAKYHS